ncbi:hypothetical protein [Staphylococcus phage SA3]|uniref:Terminal repeat-encoded protein n=7 Tax=Kayvirus TaxID=1857843 RepID=A0A3T0IDX7_9CAUD|nr:hypothetical protein P108_0116 [Staphylococcus phage P108]ARQ95960.1 hypothetical protein qdsa002_3 [Staphylococcus phage qdsa002]ASZ78139.1 hypothetical protein [Staphylococcus phage SA3]AUG85642.1 hypothetical protein HSA30_gp138 [Staphylococcus phage HSA30]AXU40165.1 hypothetical protein VBSavMJYL01_163 [Staphylococcus phage VB_SavM_JYL01]AZU97571.1 terminal repeat-encoded protein [Staphylococcus phage VB-SavM-JYL02]QEQ93192.1 hypothetical protein [Staphylococcus phage vB_SauH_IME522]Q
MIGQIILLAIVSIVTIGCVGLFFYETFKSIKYDANDKIFMITGSILMLVIIVSGALAILGI